MIEVAAQAGEGHLPSSFSVTEILWAIYDEILGPDDRFILSKGHASLALYAVLEAKGWIPPTWGDAFCEMSPFMGHPERSLQFSIEATTGSLGHGFPTATGMALAKRIKNEQGRIFCLVGDGELNEGSCWEAALLASHLKLTNLVVFVDANSSSPLAIDGERFSSDLPSKFSAFGWRTCRIDGHDVRAIARMAQFTGSDAPVAIICDTIKGRGCPVMEADPQAWHHRAAPAEMELS
jgi:transketolase